MIHRHHDINLGQTPIWVNDSHPSGEFVQLMDETYYRIRHYDQMSPFFMSLVSSADHWLFIASTGGLTAGRTNSDSALFPYETDDKITANSDYTGSKTIILATRNGQTNLWEPFSKRYAGVYRCERSLYKNAFGNKLIFEEINHDLQLTLRTAWRTGDRFGFVRSSWLRNDGAACQISLLDGVQNVLPYGVTTAMQTTLSNLLHAYKRSELDPETGLGIFALSATLSDRAEPSESLKATAVWQTGLQSSCYLLSSDQVDGFRHGLPLTPEYDVRGKAGAYLVQADFSLTPGQTRPWHIVADVNQDSAAVNRLIELLGQETAVIMCQLQDDIDQGTTELVNYVAAADGLQTSADPAITTHHFANVLFNIMRGGVPANGCVVERADLLDFVSVRNRAVATTFADWFATLPAHMAIHELTARAAAVGSPDLIRLCYEYLPLTFSRRHGDPSRPWNRFSINLKQPDGSPRLDYQGNWRDIFQNWEPLALAFPDTIEGMIVKFLNATTADGYNPYRITRDGIEWEVPEPDNPWSNIGYWSDHQIIYLQKLLEIAEEVQPGALARLEQRPTFTYASVPYRLRPYREMLADWSNTIEFDWASEEEIETAVAQLGTDGRLLRQPTGDIIHVSMAEKLLVLLLAKLTNLVPDGGIWMNTQRPEWNDANNALVGKGLSVVTAAYLRRFIAFWQAQLASGEMSEFVVNTAVAGLFTAVQTIFTTYQATLATGFDARSRRAIMDALGEAATAYRAAIYQDGLPAAQTRLSRETMADFLALAQAYVEETLHANRRPDGLYHAYNILRLDDGDTAVDHLYTMLEGQVAILSSGLLSSDEALTLLRSLRHSELYRADQHTYILYPNRTLPGFCQKNNVRPAQVAKSPLVAALAAAGDGRLLIRDDAGVYHFNGAFRNAADAAQVLDALAQEPAYAALVQSDRAFVLDLFEETFDHRAFTGRSGTFFAFEGLGSIYWHMVAKLLLAVQECYLKATADGKDTAVIHSLAAAYYDIRQGLGFNKSPAVYGAFPTDPYSHTPAGSGARQPGMTGQVKEEILTRWGELGVSVQEGRLCFAPTLLRESEFFTAPDNFACVGLDGSRHSQPLPAGSLAFTFCQTPIVYTRATKAEIEIEYHDGRYQTFPGTQLDTASSRHIIDRDGQISLVRVAVDQQKLAL
ncbi:MAG: hypothetical protein KBE23_17890 [Chloroflexi bacterium]|nr:hypothetical protein [Chloroflexota bacterium]MBP7044630.1 hypothetical protein [Chloroflexota bacterium]